MEGRWFRNLIATSQIIDRARRLLGSAELSAEVSTYLRHAQDRFGCDVAFVGQQRRYDVDRAGALIDRLPCLAIRLQATEHILGSCGRRIVIDLVGAGNNGRRSQREQRARNNSH
jgi:hypothetical protein